MKSEVLFDQTGGEITIIREKVILQAMRCSERINSNAGGNEIAKDDI